MNLFGSNSLSPSNDSTPSAPVDCSTRDDAPQSSGKWVDNYVQLLTRLAELSVELYRHPLNRKKDKAQSHLNESNPSSSPNLPNDDLKLPSDLHLADLGIGKLLEMTSQLVSIVAGIRSMDSHAKAQREDHDRSTTLMVLSCYTRLDVLYTRSIHVLGQVRSGSSHIKDIHLLMPELTIDGFSIDRCYDIKLTVLLGLYEKAHESVRKCMKSSKPPTST